MLTARIRFKKEGRSKFISHLDLNRFMMRALRRAHIPVWYTQGFNPHPYIVFALPLSLFYESCCEVMDLRIDGEMSLDEIKRRMSEQMPEGMEITSVTEASEKYAEIASAVYEVKLDFDGKSKEEIEKAVSSLLALDEVSIEKESKHRLREIDVRKFIHEAKIVSEDGAVMIEIVLPAGNTENVNPHCFEAAFKKYVGFEADFEAVKRTEILNKNGEPFR